MKKPISNKHCHLATCWHNGIHGHRLTASCLCNEQGGGGQDAEKEEDYHNSMYKRVIKNES